MRLTPNFWVKIHNTRYPDTEGTDLIFHSNRPLAHAEWTEGRIEGSIGPIRNALSGVDGSWVRGRFNVQLSDTDRYYRIKHNHPTEQHLFQKEVEVFLQSETGRWTPGHRPTKVMTGVLDDPGLADGMKAYLTGQDWLGSRRSPFYIEKKILANRPINRDIFGEDVAASSIGKHQQIVVGELSDYGERDALGNRSDKGKVVCIPLGKVTIISGGDVGDSSVPPPGDPTVPTEVPKMGPPINLTATVVGDQTGTVHKEFAVSLLTRNGESILSNIVTVENGLTVQSKEDYIELNWQPPPEATADPFVLNQIIAYRVWRVDMGGYLDVQNNDGTFVNPELQYRDGEIHGRDENDVVKPMDPLTTSTAVYDVPMPGAPAPAPGETPQTIAEWIAFLISGHATNPATLNQCYGPTWEEDGSIIRAIMDEGLFGVDLLAPGRPGWPHPTPYVDFTDRVTGEVHRTMIMYARGERAKAALENRAGFAWNMCGMEDVGDGTGEPIRRAGRVWQHILSEWVASNEGRGYFSGLWAGLPFFTCDPTLAMIDAESVDRWQEDTVGRIGDRGYKFDSVIDTPISVGEFIRQFNKDFSSACGTNQFGQAMLTARDLNFDPTVGNRYRQFSEIRRMSAPRPVWGEVRNILRYEYDYDYDTKKYKSTVETIRDPHSIKAYSGEHGGDQSETAQGLRFICDRATARDSMAHALAMLAWRPVYQTYVTDLSAIRDDLGAQVLLSHKFEALGENGYVDAPFRVIDRSLDPRTGEYTITAWSSERFFAWMFELELGDEESVIDEEEAFLLGDEESPLPPPDGAYRLGAEPE